MQDLILLVICLAAVVMWILELCRVDGEKQKIACASVNVSEPKIILLSL
ncbi:hypothetical protein [Treponema denticola]|nr:hypothetical protein [Treponema denticola]